MLHLAGEIRFLDREQIRQTLDGSRRGGVGMSKAADAKILIMRHLETVPAASKPEVVFQEFKVSPNTFLYNDIAFSPLPTPDTTLNYWVGSTVKPATGDCSILMNHILEIVCNGDVDTFEYILNFLAHMLQYPHLKPGVMIVMIGGQGTGKGSFFRILENLWSRTTLLVSNIDDVVGKFNANIERNFVLCLDEAMFSGNRQAQDRLKSMVTESTVTIEEKNEPRRTIDSFHRFFAATNHQHFAQVDSDDRRFLFLRVSEMRKDDRLYWLDLHKAIHDPEVIAAFAHDLLERDLSSFDVRLRPRTVEHMTQKLQSLDGFARYWFEVLQDGSFGSTNHVGLPWEASCFVAATNLMSGWKSSAQGLHQYASLQNSEVARSIRKLCVSAVAGRKKLNGIQSRGFHLPSLSDARAEFAAALGGQIDWGD
jgi:hypothetical protein